MRKLRQQPSDGMKALGIRRTGHVTMCKRCRRKFKLVTRQAICAECVLIEFKADRKRIDAAEVQTEMGFFREQVSTGV